MGIHQLHKTIREHLDAKNQVVTYSLSELRGQRWAVDGNYFLYRFVRSSGEGAWLNKILDMLTCLKKYDIYTIWLFDGVAPANKKDEQDKRRENSERIKSKMRAAEHCLGFLRELRMTDRHGSDLKGKKPVDWDLSTAYLRPELELVHGTELNQVFHQGYLLYDNGKLSSQNVSNVIALLEQKYDNYQTQTIRITEDHKQDAIRFLQALGYHAEVVPDEAERVCAHLCNHGYVDAVLTADTDVMAYGIPFFVSYHTFRLQDEMVIGIHMPSLLEQIGMTQEQFTDLCILSGCDYNKKEEKTIRFYNPFIKSEDEKSLTPRWIIPMIRNYGSIEGMKPFLTNPEVIEAEACRRLFSTPEIFSYEIQPKDHPDRDKLRTFYRTHRIYTALDTLMRVFA